METVEIDSRATALLHQAGRVATKKGKTVDEVLADYHADFIARAEKGAEELAVSERTLELKALQDQAAAAQEEDQ